MMDLRDKGSESEEELSSHTPTSDRFSSDIKTCVDCGTSRTPLWRGGPAGPKSLCNACGIKSKKKTRAQMGVTKEEKKPKKLNHHQNNSISSCTCTSSSADSTSKRPWAFGLVATSRRHITQRRKLGEVEQAAFLLMLCHVAVFMLRIFTLCSRWCTFLEEWNFVPN